MIGLADVHLPCVQGAFEKYVSTLRGLSYDILDVKAPRWHDDYNTFKNNMKDLEVMFQNVINTAFDGAATILAGVELLDAFSSLARREAIRRCVEKKSADVFSAFMAEVTGVKKSFDKLKSSPPLIHRDHPKYAGAALWARSLHLRVQRQWQQLDAAQVTRQRRRIHT